MATIWSMAVGTIKTDAAYTCYFCRLVVNCLDLIAATKLMATLIDVMWIPFSSQGLTGRGLIFYHHYPQQVSRALVVSATYPMLYAASAN